MIEEASGKSPDLTAIRENFEKCEKALEGHTEMVLGSLNQVPTPSLPPSSSPSPLPSSLLALTLTRTLVLPLYGRRARGTKRALAFVRLAAVQRELRSPTSTQRLHCAKFPLAHARHNRSSARARPTHRSLGTMATKGHTPALRCLLFTRTLACVHEICTGVPRTPPPSSAPSSTRPYTAQQPRGQPISAPPMMRNRPRPAGTPLIRRPRRGTRHIYCS